MENNGSCLRRGLLGCTQGASRYTFGGEELGRKYRSDLFHGGKAEAGGTENFNCPKSESFRQKLYLVKILPQFLHFEEKTPIIYMYMSEILSFF